MPARRGRCVGLPVFSIRGYHFGSLVAENPPIAHSCGAYHAPMSDSTFLHIESAAHDGAFGNNTLPEPTEAQCIAGNYKVGRATLYGLPLAIEQPRGTYRTGTDPSGKRWSNRMAAHYGYISGTVGNDGDCVDCFIGPYPRSELAFVINQNVGGKFDEHKVMLGFPDEDTARQAYLASYDRNWPGLASMVPISLPQLKWWLKRGDMARPVRADDLPYEGLENMNRKIQWDADAQPVNLTLDRVLYDVRCADGADGLLFDAVSAQDILEDSDGTLTLDALVSPFARLGRRMEMLRAVMERAGGDLKPLSVQITDPFKLRGVANVAAIFELSDGQTVSIYFHNPDVNPTKIAPGDEVISWKWLLNKKDITIVVAPERGQDLNLREVARRIMRLAAKNSAGFARVNAARAQRMQSIQALNQEIAGLEADLAAAQHQLEVAKVAAEASAAAPVGTGAGDEAAAAAAAVAVAASAAAAATQDLSAFQVGQGVRFDGGPYAEQGGVVESIDAATGSMVVRDPAGTAFAVAPLDVKDWGVAVTEDQIPFHKLSAEQQRALMAAEKAAISDETVDEFLAAWSKLTDDYVAVGYRVIGSIVAGGPEAFQMNAGKLEVATADGMGVSDASAEQVAEVRDAVRGGQVQVVLQRRWRTGVDSATPIKILHTATGKYSAFQGVFELPTVPAAADFDPTTPENYAQVRADEALQVQYQDVLDSFFQSRIAGARDALRALGWDGRSPEDARLYKGDAELQPAFIQVGAGKNVVGWSMNELADDLTMSPEQYAALVGGAAEAEVARRAEAVAAAAAAQQVAIDAYSQAYGAAAAGLNAAVATVDVAAVGSREAAAAAKATLAEALQRAGQIVGDATAGLEAVGLTVADERLAAVPSSEGFAQWGAAQATYQQAYETVMKAGQAAAPASAAPIEPAGGAPAVEPAGEDPEAAAAAAAAAAQIEAQKAADRELFQSVINGTVADVLAPELADSLEAAYVRNQNDAELVELFEQAVAAYQNAMLAATAAAV